ncbi:MAG: ribonuclease P protein subunit [Desulfurococcaceae archaeon]
MEKGRRKLEKRVRVLKHSVKNIYYHELIGLEATIEQYPDHSLVGCRGVVIDETMKTLLIETVDGRRVRVLKEYLGIKFKLPSGVSVYVNGFEILGRPEDRLKKILKRRI